MTVRNIGISIAALLLTTAASPPSTTFIIATVPAGRTAALRPQPQTGPAIGFTAAPMPNTDANAPILQHSTEASLTPSIFSPQSTYRGEGYVPGSTAQGDQQKKFKPTPGINLSVPLQ